MEINIAGYNVDIEQLRKDYGDQCDAITPEIISASYARISRDPRPIGEIRVDARKEVDGSRKSNEVIVFGMGHASIAEHAVYNLDVLGVSRFVIEYIQRSRLVSYTEKSQRYITLEDDFVIPQEIKDAGQEALFVDMVKEQNALYHVLYEALVPYVNEKYKGTIFDKTSVLEGLAKEDARYAVSLATEAQMGMTLNARNLESMLVRMFACPHQEGRAFAQMLHDRIKCVTPSLVKYVDPTDYVLKGNDGIRACVNDILVGADAPNADVTLLHYPKDADDVVLASLLYESSQKSYAECRARVDALSSEKKNDLFKSIFCHMTSHNSVPRAFENIMYDFELEISATCFAQLKRHRMATIITQPYSTALGVVVPESIKAVGKEAEFMRVIEKTNSVYETLSRGAASISAPYILTNAHKRRVLMKVNARELYHLSRLREDAHAQWDIRDITRQMTEKVKAVTPLSFLMCAGKSDFAHVKSLVFK